MHCGFGLSLLRNFPPFSFPGCLGSPFARLTAGQLQTSSGVFGVCELLVCFHVGWLDRCVFACENSASLTCAREACSKPRSTDQSVEVDGPSALSFLPCYSSSIFHTTVSTAAYPLTFSEAFASWTIFPQGALAGAYSRYRPPLRAFLWLSRSEYPFVAVLGWYSTPTYFRVITSRFPDAHPCASLASASPFTSPILCTLQTPA